MTSGACPYISGDTDGLFCLSVTEGGDSFAGWGGGCFTQAVQPVNMTAIRLINTWFFIPVRFLLSHQ
ncbi:hypothetical protein XNW1_2290007 [Xenorhabdus nematophila str. Websteri]|nr:hypothetical protein XNW1_2290007 [Xenorhabdus nematophila str. Websteri]